MRRRRSYERVADAAPAPRSLAATLVELREAGAEPAALGEPGDALEQMKHRLKSQDGRKLYGLRKQTVEPVFGIIKSVMRFRQFLLRGLEAVSAEWSMVTMAWNIRRMAVLR